MPICELFGGPAVREFPSLRILPIKSPADMAKNARMLADKGVRHFKIKVHGDVDEDVARVEAIRAEVGRKRISPSMPTSPTRPRSAIRALNAMAKSRIDLAEQPVPMPTI